MMDTSSDHGSDGTDELLTSLDPLLNQSNQLVLESSREEKSFTSSISHRSFSDDLPTQASKYKRTSPISPPFDPRHASAAEILARTERQLLALDNDRKSTGGSSVIDNHRPVKDNPSKEDFRLNLSALDDRNGDTSRNGLQGVKVHSNGKVDPETFGRETKFRCRAFKEDEIMSEKSWNQETDPNRRFVPWPHAKSWSRKEENSSLWPKKESGTESLYQKDPETKSQYQKEPETESRYHKESETKTQYQKEPDTESRYQKDHEPKPRHHKEPETKSRYQKDPGSRLWSQKEDPSTLWSQKQPGLKTTSLVEAESNMRPQKWTDSRLWPSNYEQRLERDVQDKLNGLDTVGLQRDVQNKLNGLDTEMKTKKDEFRTLLLQMEEDNKSVQKARVRENGDGFRELKATLRNSENMGSRESPRLRAQVESLTRECAATSQELKTAEAKVVELREEVVQLRYACDKKEQLLQHQDTNMSSAVAKWKTRETEKDETITDLRRELQMVEAEIRQLRNENYKLETMVVNARDEAREKQETAASAVSQAREKLKRETEDSKRLQAEVEARAGEICDLKRRMKTRQEEQLHLEARIAVLEADLKDECLHKKVAEKEKQEMEEKFSFEMRRAGERTEQLEMVVADLRQAMERAQQELDRWRSREQRWRDEKRLLAEELQAVDAEGKANLQRLHTELTARQEKERLELISAHEAAKTKAEQALRVAHRDELHTLVERHQKELSELREKADSEIGRVVEEKETALTEMRAEITQLHDRNDTLRRQKCEAEGQRLQTLSQMQHLMQASCRDALNLLRPVPDGDDVTNLRPVAVDVTNLRPAESDVTSLHTAASDVTSLHTAASDVSSLRTAASDVSSLRTAASDVTARRRRPASSSAASDSFSPRGRPIPGNKAVLDKVQPTMEAGDGYDIIDSLLRPPEPPQTDLIVFTPRPTSQTAS